MSDFNHDLNRMIFTKKSIRFKSQLPVYFESPLCKKIFDIFDTSTTHIGRTV